MQAVLCEFTSNVDAAKIDETSAIIQKYEDEKYTKPQISLRKFVANSLARLLTVLTRFDTKDMFAFGSHSSRYL